MSSLQHIITLYNEWLKDREGFSDVTKMHYKRIAQNFIKYLGTFKFVRLNDVDETILSQFAYYNAEKKLYSAAFIKVRLAALGLFFSWAYDEKLCHSNPIVLHKRAKIKHIPVITSQSSEVVEDEKTRTSPLILTPGQIQQLEHYDPAGDFIVTRNKCIVLLILDTALFVDEVLTLWETAINFRKLELNVMGDGGRNRTVTLSGARCKTAYYTWRSLRKQVLGNTKMPWLFFTYQFTPLTRRSLYKSIADYFDLAGVNSVRKGPEILRQTAIVSLLESYVPDTVKTYTGLKTSSQLEKYYPLRGTK